MKSVIVLGAMELTLTPLMQEYPVLLAGVQGFNIKPSPELVHK